MSKHKLSDAGILVCPENTQGYIRFLEAKAKRLDDVILLAKQLQEED